MIYRMRNKIQTKGLCDLINCLGNNITMVEIGSYAGESAEIFAKSKKIKRIWCIDPWISGWDNNAKASSSDYSEVEKKFDSVMKKYSNKIRKYKGTINGFIKEIKNFNPQFIYIDAIHNYESCKNDIETSLNWKSLKWIGGHDYSDGWPGVIKAVNEKFGQPDKIFQDCSWLVHLEKT